MSVELYAVSESLPERQGVSVGLYAVSLSLSRRGRG